MSGTNPWWRHQMETFSALLAICAGNSPASGEFPAQRPVTRSFDIFCDLRLNKRLSKQSWGWWLRRYRAHYDVIVMLHWENVESGIAGNIPLADSEKKKLNVKKRHIAYTPGKIARGISMILKARKVLIARPSKACIIHVYILLNSLQSCLGQCVWY